MPKANKKKARTISVLTLATIVLAFVSFLHLTHQYAGLEHQSIANPTTVPEGVTPSCLVHHSTCTGLCETVGGFVRSKREEILEGGGWAAYYQSMSDYYRCTGSKKVVEVGVAYGSQVAFHLKNSEFIEEYHVVDPFMAGYDPGDSTSQEIQTADPSAKPEDISKAWFQAMDKHLGFDGFYKKNEKIEPGGCKLRMHHKKSVEVASMFGDRSLDAVFIDGLHTYEGVADDIAAWKNKIKDGGSLIFNDFYQFEWFPGVSKAVLEFAETQNTEVFYIDYASFNALVGGKKECAYGGKATLPPEASKYH